MCSGKELLLWWSITCANDIVLLDMLYTMSMDKPKDTQREMRPFQCSMHLQLSPHVVFGKIRMASHNEEYNTMYLQLCCAGSNTVMDEV